ncbi:MAG: class I SAM-dependent methyltransferase [Amylibacter sp.]|nr:class I SAM-dependent methyltransferase [Amylibacter sp.]
MVNKLDWQGSVGKEWSKRMDGLDPLLGPVGDMGITALGNVAAKRVLDVGCGAGSTSRALASLAANVTGVDISQDLLALAKQQGAADYILANAAVDPLGGPYDAVFSRCGAMFFDDAVAGWAHIRNATVQGGNLVIVCWCAAQENGWASIPIKAAASLLGEMPPPPPAGTPGPFAWADPGFFAPILENAGWNNLAWRAVEAHAVLTTGDDPDPVARAVQFTLRIGPLARRLEGMPPEKRTEIAQVVAAAYQEYLDGDAVRVPTKAWIITGNA